MQNKCIVFVDTITTRNNKKITIHFFTGDEDPFTNPQPSTSGTQKQITPDEAAIDYSSDDSVADPTYSPDSPSLLTQHEDEMDTTVYDASVDVQIPPQNEIPESIEGTSLQQQNEPVPCRRRKKDNKIKRNLGQSYLTASGKIIGKRQMKELPNCRNKCRQKISDEQRAIIHKEVWNLGSYDLRAAFISSLITIREKKNQRRRVEDPSLQKNRQWTYTYHFNVNSEKISVCQGCFLKTLSISDNFVKLIGLKKRCTSSGIIPTDKRGKNTPANKHSEQKIQEVINHINSFPLYESHYTRRRSTRKYLPSHLTISKMYSLYSESHENPVSDKIYRKKFHKLNLSFKKPKVDTCHTCDLFKMKLNIATDEITKLALEKERDSHLLAADMAYKEKQCDKNIAMTNNKIKCLTFDLQQCLPTPALQSSVAFYKRQLWTFNLTIHDNATGMSTHHMWHEGISGRGANQIASCLFAYLREQPEEISEVILYSDTCGGQNKNTHVAAMFTYLLTIKPSMKLIYHKFMIPGHTHMEVDLDHAIIEKKKKKTEIQIYHPHDWMQLVRSSSKKFTVKEMRQNDFFDFASLLKGPLVARKKDDDGNIFKWHDVKWLSYDSEFGVIKYKTSLSREESFKSINFKRNTRRDKEINLMQITDKPVPISVEKKRDIISLLSLIPECFHNFYQNLVTTDDTKDVDPDIRDSEESDC